MPWAVCSAELTDEVPVIEAWIAVQMACDTSRGAADRRHGPLVQYSGQLYPVRMVLI